MVDQKGGRTQGRDARQVSGLQRGRRICHLTSGHGALDDRIFHKEAVALAEAGYDVVLIAPHAADDFVSGVRIAAVPVPTGRFSRMTRTDWRILRAALRTRADVYHFHDPDLVLVGLVLKALGKRVIYDMHELVGPSIANKQWLRPAFVRRSVQAIYNALEKWAAAAFDQVVLAEDGYVEYFEATHRRPYTVIRNYPILPLIDSVPVPAAPPSKPVIIYTGGLSEHRGTRETIEAMDIVGDRAELWLLGSWSDPRYERQCLRCPGGGTRTTGAWCRSGKSIRIRSRLRSACRCSIRSATM